jgi:hypothetical protein
MNGHLIDIIMKKDIKCSQRRLLQLPTFPQAPGIQSDYIIAFLLENANN